jgi:hypothetical protein
MFHIHLHNNSTTVLSFYGKPLRLPYTRCQGVTKRCRLSLLIKSALVIRVHESKCVGRGGVAESLRSQPMSTSRDMKPK